MHIANNIGIQISLGWNEVGGGSGPANAALLLEDGFYFLLEDGSFLLLE